MLRLHLVTLAPCKQRVGDACRVADCLCSGRGRRRVPDKRTGRRCQSGTHAHVILPFGQVLARFVAPREKRSAGCSVKQSFGVTDAFRKRVKTADEEASGAVAIPPDTTFPVDYDVEQVLMVRSAVPCQTDAFSRCRAL